ncbi:MAG: nitrogen regulation protein NR(I) [Burkholderiaceae bacterium]|nr:nitrogen regulation protein NR(I) [Burkholderiaceae bacterium]
MTMDAVWIVDDDQSIRWVLEKALAREGFVVRAFASAAECLRALDEGAPRVLVSDIRMPGASGIELLQAFRTRRPGTPVIIMTAFADLESAVSAFQGGAFEYLPKPFDLPAAIELIRRAVEESAREAPAEEHAGEELEMLGQAPAMQEVFRAIGRLSQSSVTVLITGESGTGKELVARALHRHSPRAGAAFVALNTAAIPRDLLESELFGHERGAFTGAQQTRRGRFEQADGGTLFLDEIGDMPAELQTRLLRVLSDGQFYRVGGHQPMRANVRVIAATHQDLEERVRQGLFREDLLHRLNVIRLRLPALRERSEDIALLARHFLQKSARELGGEAKRLSPQALRVLQAFAWPGNVRQLENTCRWLTVMAPAQVVHAKDLPREIREAVDTSVVVEGDEMPGVGEAPVAGEAVGAAEGAGAGGASRSGQAPWSGVEQEAAKAGTGPNGAQAWSQLLEREVAAQLAAQGGTGSGQAHGELMQRLTREFEATVIRTALRHTHGRRIDAALRLGIGRNTITRKIQELRLEDDEGAER